MQATLGDRARAAVPGVTVWDRGPMTASMPRTAKVIRIGTMARELLEELRRAPLDRTGQTRLWHAFGASVRELSGCLPPRIGAELGRLVPTGRPEPPGEAEIRLAQAQLTGWIEGLFQAVAASLDAEQATMLRRLAEQHPPDELPAA